MAKGEAINHRLYHTITDVPGIKLGHAQDEQARTGCTVILPEQPVVAGVNVLGLAPGTREIELLNPTRHIEHIHALVLTGGSAFGLDSASGVVQYLEEQGIGYDTGVARIPIVPAAVIYDLAVGSSQVRPDRTMGYQAARNAISRNTLQGLVGAGTGATVGKFAGQQYAMNGGIGMCSDITEDEIIVAVLVVVNALGNIIDPATGQTIAGAKDRTTNRFLDPNDVIKSARALSFSQLTNTTLAVVATNAQLTKTQATQLAHLAASGISRATVPAHTLFDGDVVFTISTGEHPGGDLLRLGLLADQLIFRAIISAVMMTNQEK